MSVWPVAPLSSSEGALVSVSITVEARDLELLLEALARVSFPINPQIRHEKVVSEVAFPAYAPHVQEVKSAVAAFGFDPQMVRTKGMWETIGATA